MLRIFTWIAIQPTDRDYRTSFGRQLHWKLVSFADRMRVRLTHPCTFGAVCGQPDCSSCSLRDVRRPTSRRLVLKRGPARVGTRIYSFGVVAIRIRRRFHTLGL